MRAFSVTDHTDRLTKLRRLDSELKTSRLLAALDATVSAGEPLHIAALARRAGVSRRFVYDHPELRAEVERRAAEAPDRYIGNAVTAAKVTAASLRADLENTKATNHRLQGELAVLRRKLGQLLGQDIFADIADHPNIDKDRASQERIDQLEQTLFEVREELARRNDELSAAREINRELMGRLNRGQR
jgi:hypothetical protein